ncbi:hypothetical protein TALC_00836 [Thermoplasmatales archaeon BRNA1]|nr:hypothetical protein TALC_00836 [Thermoplasmatales archaeon BRNA1]
MTAFLDTGDQHVRKEIFIGPHVVDAML